MSNKITNVYAREVLDSRGNPTVEATVEAGKVKASAMVPSGASTGTHEAVELRDNDKERYQGKGVLEACLNVNQKIKEAIVGMAVDQISHLDQRMIDLDGTENKSRLGANAILAVSLAAARAGAIYNELPLYKFIRQYYKIKETQFKLPVPLANVINGGKHAASGLDFQEFWIMPQNIVSFKQRTEAIAEIYHELGKVLSAAGYGTDIGDEGGYAPKLKNTAEAWELMRTAISKTKYQLGREIFFGADTATSEIYDAKDHLYHVKLDKLDLTSDQLADYFKGWFAKYPFIAIEDPFAEDDWSAWQKFTLDQKQTKPDLAIIGDDLFTTNVKRLEQGIESRAANAILIKVNQIGSLTETINCIKLAKQHQYKIAVSHRSGETEDTFIADLAVAVNAEYAKIGAPARSERVAKYNRLMEIEDEIIDK